MKSITIIALIVLVVHVRKNDAGLFTRLYYDNADCSGFHVAFNYTTSDDAPTECVSGCTEWYPGLFWVKEVCGTEVTPLYNAYFSVVRISPDETCSAEYSETGAVAEMCIVWETSPRLLSIKRSACPGDNLTQRGYSGAPCVLESSMSGYSRACSYRSWEQRSYSVPQCPLVAPPVTPPTAPVAPPVTPVSPPVNPPVTPPVAPVSPPTAPISPPVAPVSPSVAPVSPPVAPVSPPESSPVAETPVAAPLDSSSPVANTPIESVTPINSGSPIASTPKDESTPEISTPSSAFTPSQMNQPASSIMSSGAKYLPSLGGFAAMYATLLTLV